LVVISFAIEYRGRDKAAPQPCKNSPSRVLLAHASLVRGRGRSVTTDTLTLGSFAYESIRSALGQRAAMLEAGKEVTLSAD
jgi:hypothetical protein